MDLVDNLINSLKDKVLRGLDLTEDEVYALCDAVGHQSLRDAAAEISAARASRKFDACSIVNARSGKCSENCKWCAQSAHYHTSCHTYDIIDHDECMKAARYNAERGVHRFSLVASGRAVHGEALERMALMLREVKETTGMSVCASMGLLNKEELQKLWDNGVRRYHCNLETAPSHFAKLCTTHTISDKLATIRAAREIGFEVCCGGIIGMGETMHQRAEFAITLREVEPHSIPINVLAPIPGTPLADTPLISEDEILDTIAIFRFVHPTVELRFAGGRARISREGQLEAIRIGMNSGVVGDLLTTVGSTIAEDKTLIDDAGLQSF